LHCAEEEWGDEPCRWYRIGTQQAKEIGNGTGMICPDQQAKHFEISGGLRVTQETKRKARAVIPGIMHPPLIDAALCSMRTFPYSPSPSSSYTSCKDGMTTGIQRKIQGKGHPLL